MPIFATGANLNCLPPIKSKVQKDLAQSSFFVAGIGELFAKYQIPGYEKAYDQLKEQLAAWDRFVQSEILPTARDDFRMPP